MFTKPGTIPDEKEWDMQSMQSDNLADEQSDDENKSKLIENA
jgi:hypothetical protein